MKLSLEEHADTLTTLTTELDMIVNQIGLDFAKRMIKDLGQDGFDQLSEQLLEMDTGDKDVQLYRTTDSKYKDVSEDVTYRQGGEKFAADVNASHPPAEQRQPAKTLLELLVFATADEASFKKNVKQLGETSGAEVLLSDIKGSSLKGILRLMEKGILKAIKKQLKTVDYSDIRDVLRAMLVCGNKDTGFEEDTAIAVKAQAAVYQCDTLSARRSKCRLVGESTSEWRDELVNLKHTTGNHNLLVEIQIVRSKMLLQRESMGGHDGYDESRGLRGLYEACLDNGYLNRAPASSSTGSGRQLSKKEQKKVDELIAKRDALAISMEKIATNMKKIDLQIQAIRDGDGEVMEVVFFDDDGGIPSPTSTDSTSGCCIIV